MTRPTCDLPGAQARSATPRDGGHRVPTAPGLLADDGSTWTLRRILRGLSYRVHGRRLRRNLGPSATTVPGTP
jgi:hypothetical protein